MDKDLPLILGTAAGYHAGDTACFLNSLEASGFSGRCLLFTTETTRGLADMKGAARSFDLDFVPFSKNQEEALAGLPVNALRFFLYRDLLAREGGSGQVLMTDVRDVIFQADPFFLVGGGEAGFPSLALALEGPSPGGVAIGECGHTSRWVKGHLGPEVLESLKDKPLSCSGTVAGSREAVADYLDLMCSRLVPFTPGKHMAGYDQGVHNLLLHSGELGEPLLVDNSGDILTLGHFPEEPGIDGVGRVLNQAGAVPAMVHQYDRKPNLFVHVRARFGPGSQAQ